MNYNEFISIGTSKNYLFHIFGVLMEFEKERMTGGTVGRKPKDGQKADERQNDFGSEYLRTVQNLALDALQVFPSNLVGFAKCVGKELIFTLLFC